MGKLGSALAVAALAGAAVYLGKKKKEERAQEKETCIEYERRCSEDSRSVHIVGGGLAALAAAAYLVRDTGVKGENIHIYEGMDIIGGANDGAGTPEKGFVCRGGRMLNEETYENFWELFRSIPSLENSRRSVTEEILSFDHAHPTHARARLVDKDANIVDVSSMGFDNRDRIELTNLLFADETKLDDLTVEDWFNAHFFTTNFWDMWQTTFAFQRWSSLFEFRRYMHRMILEFSRIETLEGVTRTPYNQFESVILPLEKYLKDNGVDIVVNKVVTDIDFADGDGITAVALHFADGESVSLDEGDVCIMTNACMTDSATLGDWSTAAPAPTRKPISGELWAKVAAKKPSLGNPEPFFNYPEKSNWHSFTVTCRGNKLLKMIENFSGNIPGSGALMTFKDSSWRMSIVVAAQPHFRNQDANTTIFWGYGLYTDVEGDFVKKPMRDCTGEELLYEFICQMKWQDKWEEIKKDVVNVIPCFMPYVDAQFMPRKMSDRPAVVPAGSTNFAMISQFVEIPQDMVFTEEYSVRAARTAVYKLFGVHDKRICPVTPYDKNPAVMAKATRTMFR